MPSAKFDGDYLKGLDPLARLIAEQSLANPKFSSAIPLHLTQFRKWLLGSLLPSFEKHPHSVFSSKVFSGDADARKAAGLGLVTTREERQLMYDMAGYQFPEELFALSPMHMDVQRIQFAHRNGESVQGKCDLCEQEGFLSEEAILSVMHIPTVRAQICGCLENREAFPVKPLEGGAILAGSLIENAQLHLSTAHLPEPLQSTRYDSQRILDAQEIPYALT